MRFCLKVVLLFIYYTAFCSISRAVTTPYRKDVIDSLLQWVGAHSAKDGGVFISDKKKQVYEEVTGYYIPTLIEHGERHKAKEYLQYLLNTQKTDGSFGLKGESYAFDTGMVIRGWVAFYPRLTDGSDLKSRLTKALKKACSWLAGYRDPRTGRFFVPVHQWGLDYHGYVSEGIHLLVLKPMMDCGELLNLPHVTEAAKQMKQSFLSPEVAQELGITNFEQSHMLTHFYAYIQEALVELGEHALARQGMAMVAKYQANDGAVPAYYNVKYVCTTGLAQLALVWYKLGDIDRADRALNRVLAMRNEGTGGFYGSVGSQADYFPDQEISWAVKYTLDALASLPQSHFDATVNIYPTQLPANDGRAEVITAQVLKVQNELGNNPFKVLDVGAGKGRFAQRVKETFKQASVYAVDLSENMLSFVPNNIHKKHASATSLPFPDNYFAVVYAVESLEHVPLQNAAISEMVRVLCPGGILIIIDKNEEDYRFKQWTLEPWEKWFSWDELETVFLSNKLGEVSVSPIGYEHITVPDGLMLAAVGRKGGVLAKLSSEARVIDLSGCPGVSAMDVLVIIGTRPEAIKLAPVVRQLKAIGPCMHVKVWATGQHSSLLNQTLEAINLNVDLNLKAMVPGQGLGTLHANLLHLLSQNLRAQTKPFDMVVVQGDTMSTLAGAEAAFYSKIPVAHVEAGLRSHNKSSPFPEEINRRSISLLANLHFAVSEQGANNLKAENIMENVHVVGNTVIDQIKTTIDAVMDVQTAKNLNEIFHAGPKKTYILASLHRRENHGNRLELVCNCLVEFTHQNPNVHVIFLLHPNPNVVKPVSNMLENNEQITMVIPLPYATMTHVLNRVQLVFTDSGGLQEEAIALGKPVLVLRDNTDRPEGNPVVLQRFEKEHFFQLAQKVLEKSFAVQNTCASDDGDYASKCMDTVYGDGESSLRIGDLIFQFIKDSR